MNKKCSSCGIEKDVSLFSKDKTRPSGLYHKCKQCHSEYRQSKEQKSKLTAYFKEHYTLNKAKHAAKRAKRRALLLQATPKWLTKTEYTAIECKYQVAEMLSKYGNEQHAVDHIVPLQGKTVCGLHVPWNLQVISVIDNLKKGNKFDGEKTARTL